MFRSLKFKLSLPILLALLILGFALDTLVSRSFKQFYITNLLDHESKILLLTAETFPDSLINDNGKSALQAHLLFLDKFLEQRITLIDGSGKVLGDSRVPFDSLRFLENHKDRPEIRGLANSSIAHEIRYSTTLKMRMLYIACSIERQGQKLGSLRFATPVKDIEHYVFQREMALLLLIALAFAVLFGVVYFFSTRLQNVISEIGSNARLVENHVEPNKRFFGFSPETDRLYDFLDETSDRIHTLIRDLVAQREEVRVLLQSVSEAVVAVDHRMNVMFANTNACRLFDSPYSSDTLPSMPLLGFTHHAPFEEAARECLTNKRRVERLVSFKSRTNDFELKAVCTPVFQELKSNEGIVLLTLVDLTEEKKLARAKADFVEAASHELRTPLTVLKGYAETLEEKQLEPAVRQQCYDKIKGSVIRLENLTTDLLQLSYLESGKVALKYEPLDLAKLTAEITNDLKTLVEAKKINLSVECEETISTVPELLYIALYNLVTNAIKYNKPDGRIVIRSSSTPSECIIRVLDSGIGIAPEFREKVFERFFRIDRHRSRESGGTGLGLAIVKHIVNVLKGSIRVTDGLSGGAGFVISLPTSNPSSRIRA